MTSHFRENARIAPEVKSSRSIASGLLFTIVSIVLLLLALAVAHQWDEIAKAEARAAEERATDLLGQVASEHVWVRRLGQAYAKGRQDALQVNSNTPEAVALANACASISVATASIR